jgi:hypothetical protein
MVFGRLATQVPRNATVNKDIDSLARTKGDVDLDRFYVSFVSCAHSSVLATRREGNWVYVSSPLRPTNRLQADRVEFVANLLEQFIAFQWFGSKSRGIEFQLFSSDFIFEYSWMHRSLTFVDVWPIGKLDSNPRRGFTNGPRTGQE